MRNLSNYGGRVVFYSQQVCKIVDSSLAIIEGNKTLLLSSSPNCSTPLFEWAMVHKGSF